MVGTEKSIRDRVLSWDRGKIFFIQDFIDLGSQGSTRIALCNLVSDKMIYRLARGIYCFPEILNGKIVLPSDESIAYALAFKEKVRIIPYGDIAAYPRNIKLYNGHKIIFNHTSEVKMFGFLNETMMLVSNSIRYLGQEKLGKHQMNILRGHMRKVPDTEFSADIEIPPVWVQDILLELWNN